MKILEGLNLNDYDLNPENLRIEGDIAIITKMSWDYEKSHAFQEMMFEKVSESPDESLFIFCNHPSCLTLGRGLQKSAQDEFRLIDFDPILENSLDIKIHRIKRGGGITFHHEKQLIFYPIIAMENKQIKIFDLLLTILEKTKKVLEKLYHLESLIIRTDLLGLWAGDYKVASIGLSARKFISYHGLALNLGRDKEIDKALAQIYPCGISGDLYKSLDELSAQEISFEQIQKEIVAEFKI